MDIAASPGMVETPISFTGVGAVVVVVVVVVVVGCFCATSSTTFALLEFVDFLVANTFLLEVI